MVERLRVGGGNDNWEKAASFVRSTSSLITNLIADERYLFRVCAENAYGKSNYLTMKEPIVAKYQFDVPSQPDPPTVRDVDRTWADVDWEPPANSGGSKILGYQLQVGSALIY